MAGTYLSLALVLVASASVGQGALAVCGRREWSWLAPAVGLALLCAVAWGALNLSGEPAVATGACALVPVLGALACLRVGAAAVPPPGPWIAVLVGAVALASLPFIVEGRFGILGTSLNPDMSQHLFAADRLAGGGEERLISEGYPLGPHSIVVAVAELGSSLVQAFAGLTLAVAVAACLAPLALLDRLPAGRQVVAALLVGLPYMAASYLIQGAFKETLEALFVLAFAIGLHQLAVGYPEDERRRGVAAAPLALLAIGAVYAYSFPGLIWLLGAAGVWAGLELIARRGRIDLRAVIVPTAVAAGVLLVAIAPELGRMADFGSFETFDPDGAGLGNLFNPISPFEALGIWPSGDFRLDPGAGFAPAALFWLGGLVGVVAVSYGLAWWLRRGERAVPAALAAAAVLYLYALVAGTPYQESKALAVAAPLAMLVAIRPIVEEWSGAAARLLAVVFAVPAAACSVLALANGPVGPDEWTPDLIEFRENGALGPGGEDGDDTVVVAPAGVLVGEHGEDLFLWELRGGRVCAEEPGQAVEPGIDHVLGYSSGGHFAEVRRFAIERAGDPGVECPFIADGDRAEPGG
jgi:hypothetical protein